MGIIYRNGLQYGGGSGSYVQANPTVTTDAEKLSGITINDKDYLIGSGTRVEPNKADSATQVMYNALIDGEAYKLGTDVDSELSTASDNPVLNSTIAAKFNLIDTTIAGKANAFNTDSTPTANSTNLVTSGGVQAALDGKMDSFTPQDTIYSSTVGIPSCKGVYNFVTGRNYIMGSLSGTVLTLTTP